jgi:BirA family transcriptional regulator, biotin operon repressor / biotin---[acetyl-CoA-carboxylase] ligase
MPRRIIRLDVTGSTMQEAARLASEGCPSGTVVIAEEQTSGMGRHGHAWHSEARSGLYCSIVLRPKSSAAITLALGMAAADAIDTLAGVRCDLRWPNDVMLNGRKVAGILVNVHGDALIAGIGINVNHSAFPPDLVAEATSVRMETGVEHSKALLLDTLLENVDRYCAFPEGEILRLFGARSSYVDGMRVRVDGKIEGTTAGLDASGFLILKRDDGVRITIMAGGVRPI